MADFQPAASAAAVGMDSCSPFGPAAVCDSSRFGPGDRRERPASAPLVDFSAYKATRLSDIVCRRTVRLFSDDRVTTVHPSSGDLPGSEKTWFLDRTCSLQPEYVQELVAEKRTVRPPGQWTVTAKLHTVVSSQAQEPIDLYCVTIHWPTSWLATRGYTSFTLGFETVEEAAQWHALVQRQLSMLRVRAASTKGDSSVGHSSKPSYDEGLLGSRAAGSGNGTVGRKTSQGFVAAALEHFWSSGSGLKDDKQLRPGLDGCDQGQHTGSRHVTVNGHSSPPAILQELRSNGHLHHSHQQHMPPCYPGTSEAVQVLPAEGAGSFTSSSTDMIDGTAQLLQPGFGAAGHQDEQREQRWVPYRHTNGVAIYHHKESAATCSLWSCGQDEDAGGEPPGSEYMASSIVRGCPDECLCVLVDLSSNTTILGPASKIELLEDGEERQVEQQRFLVQPFSILTNNHAARASSSMATATSAAGSSAADADELEQANNLREGYSQHLRQQQLMRQRRRQLALQQQQQQAAYMQHKAAQAAGFAPADDAARMAAHGYWGSGVTASQAGLLRAGMYGPQQGAAAGLCAPYYSMPWLYKGPLLGAGTEAGGYGVQQHEMMVQGAEGGPQLKRGSSSQGRQQGRLGRMASRIYSLRPRLRKGDSSSDRASASGAAGGAAGSGASGSGATGLYTQVGASFKSGLSAQGAADAAASSAPPAAAAGAPGVAADGAADAAAAAAIAQTAAAEGAGGGVPLDLTNTPAVLRSVGLPSDTLVVDPQYYCGGPTGPAAKSSSLNHRYWSELHVPGTPAPFKLRGASYLADRTKVDGGMPQFVLGSVDLVETDGPTQHISRFLSAVRCNEAAYSFVVNLIIPGTPVLSLVAVFINEHHPDILDGPSCSNGSGVASHTTPASKSTPALAPYEQEQQQQHSTLRRLCSSSTSNLPDAADLAVPLPDSGGGGDAADGASVPCSHSHCATPVGSNGRPVDAASEGSGCSASPAGGDGDATADTDDAAAAADDAAAAAYQRPRDVNDWQPFDYVLHRFLHGGPATRQAMFKLIPHIAEGSWVIKQSVGTVPVILGNKLQTVYYQTDRYIEATVDVTSSSAAAYITSMVRGATKSLVIDLGFVLEGQRPEELPEALLGAFRLNHLDCGQAKRIDTTHELPLLPRPLQQHQLAQMAAAAAAAAGSRAPGDMAAAAAASSGAVPEAAAATGFGAGGGSHLDQQRRVCSASGATPAVSVAAAAADRAALQQQQQQQQAQARPSSTARNSASVLESGRTMTGHARSRSAASADELYLNQEPLLLAEAVHNSREQRLQQQQQQRPAWEPAGSSSSGSGASAPQLQAAPASNSSSTGPPPPSIKTSAAQNGTAGSAATEGVFAAAAAAGGGGGGGGVVTQGSAALGGVPSAARQLFGSLLPFGSSSGLSSSQQDKSAASGKAANGSSSASLSACGAVTSLLGSSTPTAAAAAAPNALSSPRNPAAGIGSSSAPLVNMGSAAHGSSHHHHHHFHRSSLTSTPTAAAAAAAAVSGAAGTPGSSVHSGQHHRTISGTSDAATRTTATAWPASPPAPGQDSSATKLSAAAFISRAHAAALAASAQRRGQRGVPSASGGAYGSPAGFSSFGSPAAASSQGGEHSYAGSPGAATSLAAAVAAGGGSTADTDALQAGGWQMKRPRASSSGVPEGERQSLEHFSSLPAPQQQQLQSADGALGSCGSVGKISASEQLRLTHSALRASATGQHPGGGSLNGGSNTRQSSTSGGLGAAEAGGIGQLIGAGAEQPALALKRRVSNHRRFASMSAMQ